MSAKELGKLTGKSWQPLAWLEEKKFPEPQKLIILTAAPGATISKDQNPNLPCTPEEIIENHVEAHKAGAAIVHIHVRDEENIPSPDPELYKRVILEIKNRCPDVIIDCCLANPINEDTVEARLKPLCELGLPIELGTISGGSFNITGPLVYINREEYLRSAAKYLLEKGIKPIITMYNIKQIEDMKKLIIEPGIIKRPFFNLSLGLFGEPARRDILQSWLRYLPEECDWVAETAGRNWLPTAVEAILVGGHVRAGMEDGIYMYPHKDDLIKSSQEAVTKVVRIAEELGREIATPKEAREILAL